MRQGRILGEIGHAGVTGHQGFGRTAHAAAVHTHLADAGLNEASNDLQQGAFAGARLAGQRQLLPRLLTECNILQHGAAVFLQTDSDDREQLHMN